MKNDVAAAEHDHKTMEPRWRNEKKTLFRTMPGRWRMKRDGVVRGGSCRQSTWSGRKRCFRRNGNTKVRVKAGEYGLCRVNGYRFDKPYGRRPTCTR